MIKPPSFWWFFVVKNFLWYNKINCVWFRMGKGGKKVKLICCVDLNNGMLFNNRRQSRDQVLIEYIYNLVGENTFWVTEFSQELFDDRNYNLFKIDDVENIGENDFIFVENFSPKLLEDKTNEIILFNWNRNYPADLFFDISLEEWRLESETEIKGASHERITKQIFKRKGD